MAHRDVRLPAQSIRWIVQDHGLLAQLFSQDACPEFAYVTKPDLQWQFCGLHSQRKVSVFLLSFNSVTVDPSRMLCLGLACMPVSLQLLDRRLPEVKARLSPVCLGLEWQSFRVTSQGASDLATKSLVTLPMSLTRRPPRYLEREPRLVAHWENICFSCDLPEIHSDVWLLQRNGLIGLLMALTATFPPHKGHWREPGRFLFSSGVYLCSPGWYWIMVPLLQPLNYWITDVHRSLGKIWEIPKETIKYVFLSEVWRQVESLRF